MSGGFGCRNEDGAEDWNRTSDTSIFSAVLYQLSYLGARQNPNHNSPAVCPPSGGLAKR